MRQHLESEQRVISSLIYIRELNNGTNNLKVNNYNRVYHV